MATKCCRNLIIDDLLNIIPISDRCPPIIQFVADINDAVDGTVVGQLTVERYIDGGGDEHVHLWEWDGFGWIQVIDSSSKQTAGVYSDFGFAPTDTATFVGEFSLDGGATWSTEASTAFDPPVAVINVWFRNTVNGCIYTNIPEIPLEAAYCLEYYLVDTSDPLFFFGTINGVDAGDIGLVLASYTDWEGNITTRAYNNLQSNPGIISIFRDSLTPVFSNLGSYVPFGGGAPVIWSPTIVNCTRNCYRAVFTVNDLDTDFNSSLIIQGIIPFDIGASTFFSDPNAAAIDLAILVANGIVEPSATMTYDFNGLEVTITICTSQEITSGGWSGGGFDTTFNYTQL